MKNNKTIVSNHHNSQKKFPIKLPKPHSIIDHNQNKENIQSQSKVNKKFKDDYDFSEDQIDEHIHIQTKSQNSILMNFNSMNNLTSSNITSRVDKKCINQSTARKRQNSVSHSKMEAQKKQLVISQQKKQLYKNRKQSLTNRSNYSSRKQQKIAIMKQQMESLKMKQCTFKPNLNRRSQYKKSNSIQDNKLKTKKIMEEKSQQKLMNKTPIKKQIKKQTQKQIINKQVSVPKKHKYDSSQFLKNQRDHLQKIAQKNQKMRRELEKIAKKQQSFSPSINKDKSKTKNKGPAHQRLYQLKDKKTLQQFITNNHTVTPKPTPRLSTRNKYSPSFVNTNSKHKFHKNQKKEFRGQILYKDAVRRSKVQKDMPENNESYQGTFEKSVSINEENHNCSVISGRTEQLVMQKFIKQYTTVLQLVGLNIQNYSTIKDYINGSETDSFIPENLSFCNPLSSESESFKNNEKIKKCLQNQIHNQQVSHSKYNQILKLMNFYIYELTDESQIAYKQRSLGYEGYQYIDDRKQRVTITYLAGFLLAVIGIYRPNNNKQSILMNRKEGLQIHKYFTALNNNRLHSNKKLKPTNTSNTANNQNKMTDKHQQYTNNLAQKFRQKIIEKTNRQLQLNNADMPQISPEQLTHQDFLTILKLRQNLSLQNQRQLLSIEQAKKCTFHPQTRSHMMNLDSSRIETSRSIGNKKSAQLYNNARKKHELSIQKQKQKDQNMQEQMKPQKGKKIKLMKNTNKNNNDKTVNNVENNSSRWNMSRDAEKAVIRMREGYKQRQQKQKYLQRGQLSYSNRSKNNTPLSTRRQNNSKINQFDINQSLNKSKMPQEQICESPSQSKTNKSRITYPDGDINEQLNIFYGDHDKNMLESLKHNWQISKHQINKQQEPEQPFLIIDINMGSTQSESGSQISQSGNQNIEQLYFYGGDQKNIGRIVNQFCIKHCLDDSCKQYLLMMVEKEMANLLNVYGIQSTLQEH